MLKMRTERIDRVQNLVHLESKKLYERENVAGRFRIIILDALLDRKGFQESSGFKVLSHLTWLSTKGKNKYLGRLPFYSSHPEYKKYMREKRK